MNYQHLTRKQEEEIQDFMLQSTSVKDWNLRRTGMSEVIKSIFGNRLGRLRIQKKGVVKEYDYFSVPMYLQFVYKLIDSGLIKKCNFI